MAMLRPAGDFDRSYEQDMALLRQPWHYWLLGISLLAAFTLPLWGDAYLVATANQIAYTIIAVQGLNILTGYTGQISLSQAAFMLVGGYASALLVIHAGLSFFIALPLAALAAGAIGLIFGLASLRVKGFYLAFATLAAQFIIPWLSRHTFKDYLGGANGAIEVPLPQLGGVNFGEVSNYFYISLVVLLITTFLLFNISRTRLGRAFVSVRDNDLAAELLGVNLFTYKLRAFFIAAMLAGLAGAIKAHSQRGVGTEFGYSLNESIIYLGMLVIGGLGTNLGPFLGVAFIILMEDLSDLLGGVLAAAFPEISDQLLTSFRPIFFGVALMLFLIYEPRGLAHRWQLLRAGWRLRPFAR